MPSAFTVILLVFVSLSTLHLVRLISREASARLKAGPVRFQLPLASLDKPGPGANVSSIVFLIAALMLLPTMSWTDPPVAPTAFLWIAVNNLQSNNPRRDERRWLVLASGLLGLVTGSILIAVGYRQLFSGDVLYRLPGWFLCFLSFFLFAGSIPPILELVSGTRVREGAIEMLGAIQPWSQVVVKGWHERDDGFALRLAIVPSRPVATLTGGDSDIVVPVPTLERPALEEFLRWHVAIVG